MALKVTNQFLKFVNQRSLSECDRNLWANKKNHLFMSKKNKNKWKKFFAQNIYSKPTANVP